VLDELDIELRDDELDIVFFRRSAGLGAERQQGGHGVRVKHIPTNLTVECVNERSQQQNKRMALAILQSKIEQLKQEQRDRELQSLYGDKGEIAWGNQIRSYVLDDRRVKDHRTLVETGNPNVCWTATFSPLSRPSFAAGRWEKEIIFR